MVSGAEIQAGFQSAKSIFDLAKGFFALKTEAEKNDAILSIQREALDTQAAYSAALKRVDDLEHEVVRLKDWSREKERYHLVDIGRGGTAYMPKPGMENGEPAHWLCPNCFNQGRKSFLQPLGTIGGETVYKCEGCKSNVTVPPRNKPQYPVTSNPSGA